MAWRAFRLKSAKRGTFSSLAGPIFCSRSSLLTCSQDARLVLTFDKHSFPSTKSLSKERLPLIGGKIYLHSTDYQSCRPTTIRFSTVTPTHYSPETPFFQTSWTGEEFWWKRLTVLFAGLIRQINSSPATRNGACTQCSWRWNGSLYRSITVLHLAWWNKKRQIKCKFNKALETRPFVFAHCCALIERRHWLIGFHLFHTKCELQTPIHRWIPTHQPHSLCLHHSHPEQPREHLPSAVEVFISSWLHCHAINFAKSFTLDH